MRNDIYPIKIYWGGVLIDERDMIADTDYILGEAFDEIIGGKLVGWRVSAMNDDGTETTGRLWQPGETVRVNAPLMIRAEIVNVEPHATNESVSEIRARRAASKASASGAADCDCLSCVSDETAADIEELLANLGDAHDMITVLMDAYATHVASCQPIDIVSDFYLLSTLYRLPNALQKEFCCLVKAIKP